VAACLLTGLACGAVNGLVTVWWGLPSFIVTLAMLEIARGGAGLVTNQRTIYFGDRLEVMRTTIGDLSVSFWIAIAIAVVGQLVLAKTVFGRYMVAIGTNEEVVRLSGIRTWPIKLAVFAISGLLASLAAVMDSARFNSALPEAGTGFELQAIAAVVIGGTSLMGGRGSVLNSVFGVLIMVVLQAGLIQLGVADPIKKLITGAVIVVAVILDRYRHRLESAQL
jgi:ribose transport system permease protein